MHFHGIYTPLVTPYNDDFSLNKDNFAALIERLIAAGVQGLIVAGTTGEYYAQSMEERLQMMRFVHEIIAGRVPLTVGTGAIRTEEAMVYAEEARKLGADSLLVATPPYAQPLGRENALHALMVARAGAGLPIMLYNYPGRMAAEMDEEYLVRVGANPQFVAIKESSGDINRVHLLARDYPHISLSCGMDDQALEFFAWGAQSWVCAGSNFAPEAHIALWKACVVEGDFTTGRRIMSAMLPLMRTLEQGGKFVQCIKYGVTARGIIAGPPRLPLRALNKDDKRRMDETLRVLDRSIAHILSQKGNH